MQEVRLQKFIAMSGVASRRKAEEMIKAGRVKIDGKTVFEPGTKVNASNNIVEVDGKRVEPEVKKIYIMLNKPEGYVSTVKDQFSRPTVLDLVREVKERVYPVGRLDYETSGLLLLTNDGNFAYRLTHPSHECKKMYIAEIVGIPTEKELKAFSRGLKIDNYTTAPAKIKIVKKKRNSTVVEITIHEGRNRQIRKMCEAIGHPVIKLKRTAIGPLKLGNIPEGSWRFLEKSEVKKLMEECKTADNKRRN